MQFVTYHYVRPSMDPPPYGYYHLSLSDFRAQLDHFEDAHTLIDRSTAIEVLSGSATAPEDAIVLTFDDGLKDHHKWVLPELERRGLWGIFFVPSGPYFDDALLDVHRVHVLCGRYDSDVLLDELVQIIEDRSMLEEPENDSGTLYRDRKGEESLTTFKRALNELLSHSERTTVLTELEHRFPDARSVDVNDYYVSRNGLAELAENGMLLGGHSRTHSILAQLERDEQRSEIEHSFDFLERTAGEQPLQSFAFPYGSRATYTDETISLLDAAGCDAAFTTISDTVDNGDINRRRLHLSRRDCTEFPHGSSTVELP